MTAGFRLMVGPACAELRRTLRPIEWVVLEDILLDARLDGAGQLVAPTSARRVAEHLSLTPGAVARALARLRSAGLVNHVRHVGPAGRFGLSAYMVVPVPGLDVIDVTDAPHDAPPQSARPRLAAPHIECPRAGEVHMDAAPYDPVDAQEHRGSVATPAAGKRAPRAVHQADVAQLTMLDLMADLELHTNPERHP